MCLSFSRHSLVAKSPSPNTVERLEAYKLGIEILGFVSSLVIDVLIVTIVDIVKNYGILLQSIFLGIN